MIDFNANQVTVIIPHIPSRVDKLARALASVTAQTYPARDVIIASDLFKEGSAATRNRPLLTGIATDWVAFLDDDDVWLPHHLETLIAAARATGAQVVYPGCVVVDGNGFQIPRREEWGRFGRPFDAELLRRKAYLPVTSLVDAELACKALFGPPTTHPDSDYDDWGFYLRLLDLGATFLHVPEITWIWHHHGANTSGRPDRW